jgi:hypothetical protein
MWVLKCDKCKEIVEEQGNRIELPDGVIHICDKCFDFLIAWLKEE